MSTGVPITNALGLYDVILQDLQTMRARWPLDGPAADAIHHAIEILQHHRPTFEALSDEATIERAPDSSPLRERLAAERREEVTQGCRAKALELAITARVADATLLETANQFLRYIETGEVPA